MKQLKVFFHILFLLVLPLTLIAQSHPYEMTQVTQANKELDQINATFIKNDLTIKEIKTSVKMLEKLQADSTKCIEDSKDQISILDDLLKSTDVDTKQLEEVPTDELSSDTKYLQDKKELYAKQASECRLLKFRIREALFAHKSKLQDLSASRLFAVSVPVWDLHEHLSLSAVDHEKLSHFMDYIGFHEINFFEMILLIIAFPISAFASMKLQKSLNEYLEENHDKNDFHVVLNTQLLPYVVPLCFSGIISFVLMIAFYDVTPTPLLFILMTFAFVYYLSMSVIKVYFSLLQLKKTHAVLSHDLIHSIHCRLSLFIFAILSSSFLFLLFSKIYLGLDILKPVLGICGYVLAGLLLWTVWPISEMAAIVREKPSLKKMLRTIFSILSAAVFVLVSFGYYRLASFMILNIIITFVATLLLILALTSIHHGHHYLETSEREKINKVRKLIGIQLGEGIFELQVFKIIIMFMVIFSFVFLMLKLWNFSENVTDEMFIGFAQGFHLVGMKIVPLQIVIASLVFSLLNIINRVLTMYITNRHQKGAEKVSQVALATVFYYVGFGLSLLMGLLVSGFNFTGVAIIAGALSIGVGLGLQAIVNNFVSGLILLIEKPIKAGDRILVGTTEGFVKKISIRSTRITTTSREDVIIPNAELISGQVTNYMFRDKSFRIVTTMGVAYDSNIELVRDVLLELTKDISDVIQETPHQPTVVFRTFADSTLIFELSCLIKDVNKKSQLLSDVNFAIHKAFAEHGIVMAFPQREVHIVEKKPAL